MKILLVSANQERIPYPVAPLGLLYIADRAKQKGFHVSILDLCFSNNILKDIETSINHCNPDCVGVSIRNVDNLSFPNSVSYIPEVKNTIDIIKSKVNVPIVLGGSAFSLFPGDILQYTNCDFGIIGEGEDAFIQFIDKLQSKDTCYDSVDNLVWRLNGEIKYNTTCYAKTCASVIERDLIDNATYAKLGGMGNIQTKRGCQFKCAYCTYPCLEGNEYRLRPPRIIVEEARQLKEKYATNHIFFVDNVFNQPLYHSVNICEAIIKSGLKINWSCFASPKDISKDLLDLMKNAGCTHIEFGSDSLSESVLSNLQKPFSINDIIEASYECKKAGIKSAHYVMFGGPGETQSSLQESFSNIKRIETNAIIAMVGIRIYPNTELHQLSIKENILPSQKSLLDPHFYLSPKIPVEYLLQEVFKFSTTNSSFIAPGLQIRSSEKMFKILRNYYQEGPLWGYLNT
jgi:radical SAM superfamily enzyme YgiQ (UPF0313 family)